MYDTARYAFHVSVHMRPHVVPPTVTVALDGAEYVAMSVEPRTLREPFLVSFEEAIDALAELERMFVEPDGSFCWVSTDSAWRWQLDGNLYDRAGRVLLVDLKGCCPQSHFDRLLAALGHPRAELVFQLVREAVFLPEAAFRQYAQRQGERLPAGQ